jgi:hypothetical protein
MAYPCTPDEWADQRFAEINAALVTFDVGVARRTSGHHADDPAVLGARAVRYCRKAAAGADEADRRGEVEPRAIDARHRAAHHSPPTPTVARWPDSAAPLELPESWLQES